MTATKSIAQRIVNAENEFISNLQEAFDLTEADAIKVFQVFRKAKAIKLAAGIGRYNLQHGAFWDRDVIDNALNMANKEN